MSTPSFEEALALIARLEARLVDLERSNARLVLENAELRRRAGLDSSNSGKPPSSDGLAKRSANKSLRKVSGRAPGRAKGDPGAALSLVDDPQRVEPVEPGWCGGCGRVPDGGQRGYLRRQRWDLPEIRPVVTEFRLVRRSCSCGHVTTADPPEGVAGPVSYGPQARAAIVLLSVHGTIAARRLTEITGSLLGLPVSTGTVTNLLARAHDGLEVFEKDLKRRLQAEPVVHADETGIRVAGKLAWLHTLCMRELTWLGVHERRGRVAMNDLDVLPGVSGVLVTDALGAYTIYGTQRALCGAHVLRELNAIIDHPAPGSDPTWATAMKQILLEAKTSCDDARAAGRTSIETDVLDRLRERYKHTVACGLSVNASGGDRTARALARRLRDRAAGYQLAWTNLAVPFDNNQAERDLRMVKAQQKISGGWRTHAGADRYARIRSYLATTAKHCHDRYTALIDLFTGQPWQLPTTA